MKVKLKKASIEDAELIWKMQIESFSDLLNKYRDYETSPANEPLEKTVWRLSQKSTYYYLIEFDGATVGAIRIIDGNKDGEFKRISPLFILPEYRNKGIAQKAVRLAEELHGQTNWKLETILQEEGNCHLYEKMKYRLSGEHKIINDKMTLVYYIK